MRFSEMRIHGNGSGTIYVYTRREPFWNVPERQPQPFRSGTVPLGTVVFTLMLGTVLERLERFLNASLNVVLGYYLL